MDGGQIEAAGTRTGAATGEGPRGGDLLIVDNSVSGWTGAGYLREWSQIATSFDIATGFFEIGSLLELDGHWQQLDKIRILIGSAVISRGASSSRFEAPPKAAALTEAAIKAVTGVGAPSYASGAHM